MTYGLKRMDLLGELAELDLVLVTHPFAGSSEVDGGAKICLARSNKALLDKHFALLDTSCFELDGLDRYWSGTHLLVAVPW